MKRSLPLTPVAQAILALAALSNLPVALAQTTLPIIPDRSAPGSKPIVEGATSGVPVVHVAPPSANGVSMNNFLQYNVGTAGVVLNNSGQESLTKIAGRVQGNPWLAGQQPGARTIVNQVTAANASQLLGITELAGRQANVVISNPAGITCNGCGFVGIPRVTLTTGTPLVGANGLTGFDVRGGQVAVGDGGLDARGSQIDLIARALAINGQVWADRANAIAGANTVDYASGNTTAVAGVGAAPAVAIDMSALGGMYAGAVRMVGTEAGVGVNLAGEVQATTGEILLAANGAVSLAPAARLQSAWDMALSGTRIDNAGAVVSAGDLALAGDLHNQGTAVARRHVRADAATLTNAGTLAAGVDATGKTTQPGNLTLNADALTNTGALAAGGQAALVTQSIDNQGDVLAGSHVAIAADTVSNRGNLLAGVDANGRAVQAGDLSVRAASLSNSGTLGAGGDTTLTADTLRNSGRIGAQGSLTATAQALDNTAGHIAARDGVALRAVQLDNTGGLVHASGLLDVTADTVRNANANASGTGDDPLGLEGQRVRITAQTLDNTAGAIRSDTDTTLATHALNNTAGTIASAGRVSAAATGTLNAGTALAARAGTLAGDGTLQSAGDVSLKVDSGLDHGGKLVAGGNLDVAVSGDLVNRGTMAANSALSLNASNIDNRATGELTGVASNTLVTPGTLTNDGLIDGGITSVRAGPLVNTGRLYGDTVSIGAGSVLNDVHAAGTAGVIASRGDLDIGAQTVTNREHALIYSAGDMRIGGALDANGHATGRAESIVNSSATINADGDLTLAAQDIKNGNAHLEIGKSDPAKGERVVQYEARGIIYDAKDVRLYQINARDGALGTNPAWLSDDDYKMLVRPSDRYPFDRYGPAFDYAGGWLVDAYVPEGGCPGQGVDSDCRTPETFNYAPDAPIWKVFGLPNPPALAPKPDPADYGTTFAEQQRYQADLAAWKPAHDAQVKRYEALNADIGALLRNLRGRTVENFAILDGTQRIVRDVVAQSDPGVIASGGAMTFDAGRVSNYASQFVAGGVLGGPTRGTTIDDDSPKGKVTTTVEGTASYSYVTHGVRQYKPVPFPNTETTDSLPLDFSATLPGRATRDDTVKAVPAAVQPATGSAAEARTSSADLRLPNNALYQLVPDPGSSYLIQTDPRFTSFRQWISSDAMLAALKRDPSTYPKRLGDGLYEQQLIQQQILNATGRRFVGDYTSNEAQYKALIASGVEAADTFGLTIGTALSAEQMSKLTTDIVWLVNETVTLPDGSRQTVLVPKVYLMARAGEVTGTGSLIAGDSVKLENLSSLSTTGTIAGLKVTVLSGDTITNRGTIASAADGAVSVQALSGDLDAVGGRFTGGDVALLASRDVRLGSATATSTSSDGRGSATYIDRIGGVDAKSLSIDAGRDAVLTAAAVRTTGDTVIQAQRDVTLNTVKQSSAMNVQWDADNRFSMASSADTGTVMQAGGKVVLNAGRDVNATAATVSADGAIGVLAGRDVNLSAGHATSSVDSAHKVTESGFLSSKTTTTRDTVNKTTVIGTTLSGDTVTVAAGQDINVKGSGIAATRDATLLAKHDINIEAATATTNETHFLEEKRSGLMGAGGVGFTIGTRQQSQDDRNTQTTAVASTIGSIGGNVTIAAGNHYSQVGSNVIAMQGDVDILAKKVDIVEAREGSHNSQETKFQQSGLTIAVTAPVIAALQTASQMGDAASETSDARMKVLAGGATALAAKNAADAIAADPKSGGGASIAITVGGSKSESRQTQDTDNAAGSTVKAGGDVRIRAIGDGQNSTLTVQGSDIQAGKDALLKADGDINLLAAKNTSDMERSSSSKSGGVGVAVSVNSNGASLGVTASASASRGSGNGHDVTWSNTHIDAGNRLTLASGGDTNLKGAVATGKQVVADVGGNLNMASLQDTSTFHSKDQSIGGSVTVGSGFSGSVNASQQKIDSDYASVTEQSGIKAGDGGFQVNVRGNTDLKGAVIASTDKAVEDGANRFNTGTLTLSDIENHAEYSANSVGVTLSGGKDVKGGRFSPSGAGVGHDSGDARSVTASGISGVAGNTAVRTGDAETGIAKIFDADKVQREINAQMQITQAFSQQAGEAVSNYVEKNRGELIEQMKQATTAEERSAVQGKLDDLTRQERVMNILIGAVTGQGVAAVTKETLSVAADEMRTLMIADSAKFAGVTDGTTTYTNLSAESAGVRGDGKKVGGTRWDLDELCGPDNVRCKVLRDTSNQPILDANGKTQLLLNEKGQVQFDPDAARVKSLDEFLQTKEGKKLFGATGGIQGVKGTLFGIPYEAGSWQDKLIESFSGTHDLIGGKLSGLYDDQGNAARGRTDGEKIFHETWTIVAIPISAPFAMAEHLPSPVWNAISILLKAAK